MKTTQSNRTGGNSRERQGVSVLLDGTLSAGKRRMGFLLIVITMIAFPEMTAWPATRGFFIAASPSEIAGSILLAGLCLIVLAFGLRLIFRSVGIRR